MHYILQNLIGFCRDNIKFYERYKRVKIIFDGSTRSEIDRDLSKPIELDIETFLESPEDRIFKFDSILQSQYEKAFGEDLSDTTIHTGPYADTIAKSLNAEAVTIGSDVYFRAEKYSPETEEGKKLLAHELQHVIQYLKDDRMVYLEDIEAMEMEAESTERIIEDINLYDIKTPYLKDEATQGIVKEATKDEIYNKPDILNKNLYKKSNDGFLTRNDKPLYKIIFNRTGKSYKLTKEEKEKVINVTINKLKRYIQEETFGMREEEKDKYYLKIIKYFS